MSYQKKKKTNSERQFNEITHTYAQKHRFRMRYLPEIENIKKEPNRNSRAEEVNK